MEITAAAELAAMRQDVKGALLDIVADLEGQIERLTSGVINLPNHPSKLDDFTRQLVTAVGGFTAARLWYFGGRPLFVIGTAGTDAEDLTVYGDCDHPQDAIDQLADLLGEWYDARIVLSSDKTKSVKHGFDFSGMTGLRDQVVNALSMESAEHDDTWMLDRGPAAEVAAFGLAA